VYCTQSRHDKPRPLADKVLTYLITEFGLDISSDKNEYIDGICSGNKLVVASSQWVIAKLVEFGFSPEKIKLVPHGVNPQIFFPSRPEERSVLRSQLNASPEHFVFLNVGAMTWNKGIDLLLRAFAEIRNTHRHARLVLKDNCKLYGFGVDDVVQKMCVDYPHLMTDEVRSSIVLIKSTLSLPQLRLLYGSADAYVSPYRAEGFNLPVIESIACGTPVIVTSGGPTDDFCDDDTASFINSDQVENRARQIDRAGFHLEPDVEHLVHQMESAITGRDQYKSSFVDGRSRMLDNFSWEVCTKKLALLF
jgi:glycosyltransferase involved in cell wall biosynthesis